MSKASATVTLSMKTKCVWRFDGAADKWDTACGDAFTFIAGGPQLNNFHFCPYCGAKISVRTK